MTATSWVVVAVLLGGVAFLAWVVYGPLPKLPEEDDPEPRPLDQFDRWDQP